MPIHRLNEYLCVEKIKIIGPSVGEHLPKAAKSLISLDVSSS
jgi:hypothetical protein